MCRGLHCGPAVAPYLTNRYEQSGKAECFPAGTIRPQDIHGRPETGFSPGEEVNVMIAPISSSGLSALNAAGGGGIYLSQKLQFGG